MCGDFHSRVYYDTLYAVFSFLKNVLPSQPQRTFCCDYVERYGTLSVFFYLKKSQQSQLTHLTLPPPPPISSALVPVRRGCKLTDEGARE